VHQATYCVEYIRIAVKSLTGYQTKEWGTLSKEMKDLFHAHDRPQHTKESLNDLVRKGQGTDLRLFNVTYAAMSNDLVKREVLTRRQQVLEFIVGLGTHLRYKAFEFAAAKDWKLTEDDTGSKEPNFAELQDHILDKAKSDQKNAAFERHFQGTSSAPSAPNTLSVDPTSIKASEDDEKCQKLIE
jgi:hypothetical protein